MSRIGDAPRAAVPVSNARAEASRRNGARSRGPRTPEGKARSSRNALKHGLRAVRHVMLPQEDAAEFADLQRALFKELAPVGALQTVLARRIVVAAWRLARADRMEAEVLEFRSYEGATPGLALIRDGNGTRAVETLLRYRGAAMAEFTRSLRTLKALQAESRQTEAKLLALPAAPAKPNEPEKGRRDNGSGFARGVDRGHALGSGPSTGSRLPEPCDPRIGHSAHPRVPGFPAPAWKAEQTREGTPER